MLDFGGTSAVDAWMAACKGGAASDGADEPQEEQRVQPTDALLALSLDALLWVSDTPPWRFTPAATACAPLADLLRSSTTPWDLRLIALLLWATGGGPAPLRSPAADDGLEAVSRVQRLWCALLAVAACVYVCVLVCACMREERDKRVELPGGGSLTY